MMHIIPKWKVSVRTTGLPPTLSTFWIYDSHLGNVLRKLADIQFTENGLNGPTEITVSLVSEEPLTKMTMTK